MLFTFKMVTMKYIVCGRETVRQAWPLTASFTNVSETETKSWSEFEKKIQTYS